MICPAPTHPHSAGTTMVVRTADWNADGQIDVLTGYFAGPWVDPVVDLFLGDGSGGVSADSNVLSGASLTGVRMASPIQP